MSNSMKLVTEGDRHVVVTRRFAAPPEAVYRAHTEPAIIQKWILGPDGWTMPVCEIDLRPGGSWSYVWRNPQGREFGATGTYREVDPPKRMVQVTKSQSGEEQTNTTTFTEENGRTTVTVSMLFGSKQTRDQGMPYAKMGLEGSYASLDAYLASQV